METVIACVAGFLLRDLIQKTREKKTKEVASASVKIEGQNERTYIMVKPDGVNRNMVAEVISRFTQRGYKLTAIKMLVPSKDLAAAHYAEHEGKPFFPKLVSYLSGSGPVVGMCFEGKGVIATGRQMIGTTNPSASAPGTIRGDLAIDTGRNVIHGSDSAASAEREIGLWFPEGTVAYESAVRKWTYE